MCCDGQDAHTTHEHRTGELGHWSAESGRCAGAMGGLGCGDVPDMGGKGGGDQDLRAGLQGNPNHPDRLLLGGLLGPRWGVEGGSQLGRARVETRGDGKAAPLGKKFFYVD